MTAKIINYRPRNKSLIGLVLIFWLLAFMFVGCKTGGPGNGGNGQDNNPSGIRLSAEGRENTLEIASWNLKNFPASGSLSIDRIFAIISQLDIDLYAIQEIADISAFQQLLDRLSEYDGLYSEHVYQGGDYQKTGIIYKHDMVTVRSVEMLFTGDTYAFPRPPLLLEIDVQKNGMNFDFYLIVIHLKAYNGPDDLARRRAAAAALKDYMDQRIASESETEKDYIVAGDWNDEIDDPIEENAFQVFVDAPESYRFLTMALVNDDMSASYPSWGSLIDHILISSDCFFEYQGGSTKTLRLDDENSA
jgi:endonuclease/exonuclease/phosphatase family metal-dependent hydrolase